MDAPPLDVSPVAKFLLGLADRRATGAVAIGGRTLLLAAGEICDVSQAEGDLDLGDFLLASARLSADQLAEVRAASSTGAASLDQALVARGYLTSADLTARKRALWLERFVRGLRQASQEREPLPTLDLATPRGGAASGVRLLPFALDALARLAADADATTVGMSISHRLTWTEGPLTEEARRWAAFGDTTQRPVVSSILARLPAVAPQIAALVRAGLARLHPPGTAGARTHSRTGTLPPPPPRLSVIPDAPPLAIEPHAPKAAAHPRSPRLRLDPGADASPIESIPQVELPRFPDATQPLQDPLREIELRIAALEEANAPGPERARAFVELARLWRSRLGSLEEATRALREAAAADPANTQVLQEAALHCSYLGQAELAVAYAKAAIAESGISIERAAAYRLLSEIYRATDDVAGCVDALSEAAAEDPSDPEPHELLAHLLAERDNLPMAVAHARLAALGWAEHDKAHAALLYGLAYAWNPSDPQLAEEYAALLRTLGHAEAAVTILAETARNQQDPSARRQVRLRAAQCAEAARRRDLATELLIELFDEDPHFNLIHAPLDEELNQPESAADHLAFLETITLNCPSDQQSKWLARAGEVALGVAGEQETAACLLARALDQNPALTQATESLRRAGATPAQVSQLARGDEARLAETQARLRDAPTEQDEARLHAALAALYARLDNPRAVASHALRALAIDPGHAMSLARLWRAAASLRDPALLRESLTLRARRLGHGRAQGRALAVLARQLENMEEYGAALASAESALASDPSAADAAVIVLRHAHRLEPDRALTLLKQARTLLGDLPALLSATAEAARAAGDFAAQLAILQDHCHLMPRLPEPRLAALSYRIEEGATADILEEADALLRDAGGPTIVGRVRDAVERLAELGAHEAAAQLAQRVMDELGHSDPSYADHALQLAQATGQAALISSAMERALSAREGSARLARLLSLAEHHAQQGDRVAQVRALLRALAVDVTCAEALTGLSQLFTEAGDANRLLTVLALLLETQNDPEARRKQLLHVASAAAAVAHDLPRAAGYLKTLMAESTEARPWLLRALGALFALGGATWAMQEASAIADALPAETGGAIYLWIANHAEVVEHDAALALELAARGARRFPSTGELLLIVERLTLAAKNSPVALSVYDDLIASSIGPHGQRALHYRAGRWLERAGSPVAALDHYAEAFRLAMGAGVAYKAIARVARATGRLEVLVDAQQGLAETLRDQAGQIALLKEAARICVHELGAAARGFRILMKADELSALGELDADLIAAAHELCTKDPAAADQALSELAASWERRAENAWDAEAKARELQHAASFHLMQRKDPAAALQTLSSLLTPEGSAGLPEDVRDAILSTQAAALNTAPPRDEPAAPARVRHTAPPVHITPLRPPTPAPADDEQALRVRADHGDTEALVSLVDTLAADATRDAEAHHLLGRLVRAEPYRVESLRKLKEHGARAEAVVCGEILSLFDTSVEAEEHEGFHTGLFQGDELYTLVETGRSTAAARLLGLLWENARAIPRFRRTLESYDLGPRQRASLSMDTPAARTFARAARLLGRVDTPLYLKPKATPALTVVPTHPPAVVARADLKDLPALTYRMAQCVVWAQPDNAILCVLPESEGRELVAAMLGAFGPPGSAETLDRAGKELASSLWHTVPVRVQAEMREFLEQHLAELDYDALRNQSTLAAHRAGLFVIGNVRLVLEALATLEPSLRNLDIHTELGFQNACHDSEVWSEIIRTALSEPYLSLVAQML